MNFYSVKLFSQTNKIEDIKVGCQEVKDIKYNIDQGNANSNNQIQHCTRLFVSCKNCSNNLKDSY